MPTVKKSLRALGANPNWNVNVETDAKGNAQTASSETIQTIYLSAILQELQTLNRTLGCYRVQAMADAMIRLDRRVQKHMPLGPGRKKKG
jgi:hypothetical protein